MPDDRRSARRARLSGIRVAYESSTGESHEARVANLSREGVFIASATPLAVGKRLSLEIHVTGEATAWAALGRVVWSREVGEGDDLPGGMAVKFIDVDDAVVAAIERLLEAREPTEPGLGERAASSADRGTPRREPPRRERTMLGVGTGAASPFAPAAPDRAVPVPPSPAAPASPGRTGAAAAPPAPRPLPSREKTIVGVGMGGAADVDPREPSLAIDLVAKKPPSTRPPSAPDEAAATDADPVATVVAAETPPTAIATAHVVTPASDPPEVAPTTRAPDPAPTPAARRTLESGPERVEPRVEPQAEREVSEAPAPRRRSGSGWLLLLLLIACGGAGYAFRDRLLPFWFIAVNAINRRLH